MYFRDLLVEAEQKLAVALSAHPDLQVSHISNKNLFVRHYLLHSYYKTSSTLFYLKRLSTSSHIKQISHGGIAFNEHPKTKKVSC
jgi:hypothetical protein